MPPSDPSKMTLDQIKAEPALGGALLAFMKKSLCEENFLFYFAKGDPLVEYEKYIIDGARKQVNISSKVRKVCDAAKAKNDKAAMKKAFAVAKKEVASLTSTDTIPKFKKSDQYKAYTRGVYEKEVGTNVNKAAKILGISNKKLLTDAMVEQKLGNKAAAKKKYEELAKKEKMKEKADALMKNLTSAGLV